MIYRSSIQWILHILTTHLRQYFMQATIESKLSVECKSDTSTLDGHRESNATASTNS